MKKFVAGSIGTLLMSAGLVAAAGTAAQADPYPGTVATTTTVSAPAKVKRKKTANVCATVAVKSGTGTPVGTVTITVTRNAGKFRQSASFAYSGGQVCLQTKALKKTGGYAVKADYSSKAGTVFNDSTGVAGFDVVQKKKK